jgi:hypothetical protein
VGATEVPTSTRHQVALYDGPTTRRSPGPAQWIAFDNGEARKAATLRFLQWFTAQERGLKDSI